MLFGNDGHVDNEYISTESMNYIMEAVMRDGLDDEDISAFLENQTEVNAALNENILMEKTIVRLDKKAKLSKAHKMAIFTIAKEKKDPKYKKLVTVWKMERFLEAYLAKKYGNEALRRAKKAVANSQKSSSSMVQKAANKVKTQLNGDKVKK
jgi:hypothetical protein